MAQMEEINEPILIDANSKHIVYTKDLTDPYILIEDADLVPALGRRAFDGHIYISGATGAGKSVMIRKIVENDAKNRPIILFTDAKKKDPAFEGLKYFVYDNKGKHNADWLKKNEENKIMVFDDVRHINKSDITKNNPREDINEYRDKMLEQGRKMGVTVICVNHKLQNHYKSEVPLNDARFVITFPNSNRGSAAKFLKNELEVERKKIPEILDIISKEGRQLIIHRHSPNFVCGKMSIFLL